MGKQQQARQWGEVVEAPGLWKRWLDRLREKPVSYALKPYLSRLEQINALEDKHLALSDEALRERAEEYRRLAREGAGPEELLVRVFALVRECARRTLQMRHFEVQLIGGMVLAEGKLVEMATGEGKTLVAVLPAVLHALCGEHVHILTFNDYLARRDATWMGPIYEALGVTVRFVEAGMSLAERQQAYRADVTYVTAKEAGFDYLRDGLCYESDERTQQAFDYAIVDEADSILIDEARIPLVIAGQRDSQEHNATRLAALIRRLKPQVHYEIDEKQRNVFLTEEGFQWLEEKLGCGSLHDAENARWLVEINHALHARVILQKDVDYIVRNGAIEFVDEFTGRVVLDRHWPDGLQAALEAKEGLTLGQEGEIFGNITLQHYFGLYQKLAGMTATARPEEEEIQEFYNLTTVVLPTNQTCIREDLPDLIFTHREAKNKAIVAAIQECHQRGQPVLVGTASVRESEMLAMQLRERGLACQVLNAKTDDLEADIIAEAGAFGAITISTNMAGRGTDIQLGGSDGRDRDRVVAAGGLHVIGTNRYESRRIDRQLRGRSGRQGDPGSSRFYLSLEDEIFTRYGVDDLLPEDLRQHRDQPIDHPLALKRINWAQKAIEGQNFGIRKTLWTYSSLLEKYRVAVRETRDALLAETEASVYWDEADPERYEQMLEILPLQDAVRLEHYITFSFVDRHWVEYLLQITALREGIHTAAIGNLNPFHQFFVGADKAFQSFWQRVQEDVVAFWQELPLTQEGLSLDNIDLQRPSATWTYLIDEDPFQSSLGLHISGNLALSLGAAIYAPLYMAIAAYKRWFKR